MKVVTDPEVYGQAAKVGVFIPLEELELIKGFEALEKSATKAFNKADKKREYYRDLHDSGEASERQTTALFKWDAKATDVERMIQTLKAAKRRLQREKNK